jgi:hypothetical protein
MSHFITKIQTLSPVQLSEILLKTVAAMWLVRRRRTTIRWPAKPAASSVSDATLPHGPVASGQAGRGAAQAVPARNPEGSQEGGGGDRIRGSTRPAEGQNRSLILSTLRGTLDPVARVWAGSAYGGGVAVRAPVPLRRPNQMVAPAIQRQWAPHRSW